MANRLPTSLFFALLALAASTPVLQPVQVLAAPQGHAIPSEDTPGTPFSADRLASLLPPSVYFQGRSAPIQIRNASGTSLVNGPILWATLVDTSGYSTSVQDRYQFYFVTEGPLLFGKAALPAGAYGGGFLADHFLIMDLGGHTVAEGPLETDTDLRRPRPLMLASVSPSSVRLYLGRHWVLLQKDTHIASNSRQ